MLYELPPFSYEEPKSVEEAVNLLNMYGSQAKILAGGTELLNMMKDRIEGPTQPLPKILINVKKIPELKTVSLSNDGHLSIGAATTLSEIADNKIIKEKYTVIREASNSVATKQIRTLATVGGNLCQRPWCWYFRHPYFICFKKGGKLCYAVAGDHRHHFSVMNLGVCIAGHPSDLAPALMALDASLEIASQKGRRQITLPQFYVDGREKHDTVLQNDELIVRIIVPPVAEKTSMAFVKSRLRGTWDFSMVNAAVVLEFEGRECSKARIAMGGISPYPFRLYQAEKLLEGSSVIDVGVIRELVKNVFKKAKPLAMTAEKIRISSATLFEALVKAAGLNSQY